MSVQVPMSSCTARLESSQAQSLARLAGFPTMERPRAEERGTSEVARATAADERS